MGEVNILIAIKLSHFVLTKDSCSSYGDFACSLIKFELLISAWLCLTHFIMQVGVVFWLNENGKL